MIMIYAQYIHGRRAPSLWVDFWRLGRQVGNFNVGIQSPAWEFQVPPWQSRIPPHQIGLGTLEECVSDGILRPLEILKLDCGQLHILKTQI